MTPFVRFAALFAALSAVALVLSRTLPLDAASSSAAALGVSLALASGLFALLAKRWAVAKDPTRTAPLSFWLKIFSLVFAARFVVMGAGLWSVARHGEGELSFVAAFFGCYFLQQWLEISYVLASAPKAVALSSEVTP